MEVEIFKMGSVTYGITKRLGCGHFSGFSIKDGEIRHNGHIGVVNLKRTKNLKIKNMILLDKENIKKAYLDFPEYRKFLKTLAGDDLGLTSEEMTLLKQQEEIEELKKRLENCSGN